jgi:hypothetical protein
LPRHWTGESLLVIRAGGRGQSVAACRIVADERSRRGDVVEQATKIR